MTIRFSAPNISNSNFHVSIQHFSNLYPTFGTSSILQGYF